MYVYCLYSGEPTDNCCEIDKIDISIASAGKIFVLYGRGGADRKVGSFIVG